VLEGKTGGAFREGLLGLLLDPVDALCAKLKGAMEGMGTNESTITRILGCKYYLLALERRHWP
jgi:annexin A7/11